MTAGRRFDHLRVDQVGSLLRPTEVKTAFGALAKGEIDEVERTSVEDAAIRAAVTRQVELGLPIVTDGEFRRIVFMESFADVAGFEQWKSGWTKLITSLEEGAEAPAETDLDRGLDPVLVVREPATSKLALTRNRPVEDWSFIADQLTDRGRASVTVIGPDRITQGFDPAASTDFYDSTDVFVADVIAVQKQIIGGLVEAGCEYVHLDEPGFTAYVDEASIAALREQGEDPAAALTRSIAADNAIFDAFPGTTFGVHVCRGNRQSHWHREGFYDAIAEELFATLRCHRLLLEYDTERAGSFEPLRHVRKDTVAVLGLISTKSARIETVDELTRRIEEATKYLPVEQLALSPQCGFASVIAGNRLTEDDQWRKFEVMLATAEKVWGSAGSVVPAPRGDASS